MENKELNKNNIQDKENTFKIEQKKLLSKKRIFWFLILIIIGIITVIAFQIYYLLK